MECKGIFGRWFGHSYKDVYDKGPTFAGYERVEGALSILQLPDLYRASMKTAYVASVCRRCGNQVRRA